jgi:hypothetical protein
MDLVTKLGWGGASALLIALGLWLNSLGWAGPGVAGMVLSAGFSAMLKARGTPIGEAAIIGAPGVAGGGAYFALV